MGELDVETALLALKIGFLVLLYLFIWRIVASAAKEVRTPQESMIITPGQAAAVGLVPRPGARGRLVVVDSPALERGDVLTVDGTEMTFGRGGQNTVPLDGDEFASAQHARVEARPDGLWVEDLGSTNGTFVNGSRISSARKLIEGDVIRVGQTDLEVQL